MELVASTDSSFPVLLLLISTILCSSTTLLAMTTESINAQISSKQKPLVINLIHSSSILSQNDVRHTAVIDTGTVKTRLAYGYFSMIQGEFRSILNGLGLKEITAYNDITRLCYSGRTGDMEKDLQGFPLVRFQFTYGGAVLELDSRSLFSKGEWPKSYCLAMSPSIDREQTIIGLMAQQFYNMGFDIDGKKWYVQKVDCEYYGL